MDDAQKRAEQIVGSDECGYNHAGGWAPDHDKLREAIAAAIREAVEQERGKGYGSGFSAMAEAARPLAEMIVDGVRVNTPDLTGLGMVSIAANNIAVFVTRAVAVERERCAKIADRVSDRMGHRDEVAEAIREGKE